jgi:hypothetical protein
VPDIFGIDIAGIVADATDGQLLTATVVVRTDTARNPASLTSGQGKQDTPYQCQGLWTDFTTREQDTDMVEVGDRKALLIGNTLPPGIDTDDIHSITMDGATLYVVRLLASDPARATYTFQCRGRNKPS